MRLPLAGPRLTPLQALSHPTLWTAGTPTLAPTMPPPSMPPPTSPWQGQAPDQAPMLPDAPRPGLPSPWIAALLGGLTGAADAANGSNFTGGLTRMWDEARQRYAEAQSAVDQENALRTRQNVAARNTLAEKDLGFQADVTKDQYHEGLRREGVAVDYAAGGPHDAYDARSGQRILGREKEMEGLRYGHAVDLEGLNTRNERSLAEYRHTLDAGPETPEDKLLKNSDAAYKLNNADTAFEISNLEKFLSIPYYLSNPDLPEVVKKSTRLGELYQHRENFRRSYIQAHRGGVPSVPSAPSAPSRVRDLLDRLSKAGVHDD